MADTIEKVSTRTLREYVLDSIARVLYEERFPTWSGASLAVLHLVDAIAAYHEEGKELFPHIVITTDLADLLKPLPFGHQIVIRETQLTPEEFGASLKLCAPLAVDGWVVFNEFDVDERVMRSGLISAELSDTSPSLHRQLIGDMASTEMPPVIYLSNVGQRRVLIEGRRTSLVVSLTLRDAPPSVQERTTELASVISSDVKPEVARTLAHFLEKQLDIALKDCHGTLIGVVKDSEPAIEAARKLVEDGLYLPNPIDLAADFECCEVARTLEAATKLRIYSNTVGNMLDFDGITLFTTTARVLAYHCFIRADESRTTATTGGARSRAYNAMTESNAFVCCYCKSQDGSEKIWRSDGVH